MARPQPPITDLPVDLTQLDVALAQAPPLSEGGVEAPSAPDAIPAALDQLQQTLVALARLGAIQQRADGSFIPTGYSDPRAERIQAQGSACTCQWCTSYNQRHWFCSGPGCYSGPYEWVTKQPNLNWRIVLLGEGGKGGLVYLFCKEQCRANFDNQHQAHQVQPVQAAPARDIWSNLPLVG